MSLNAALNIAASSLGAFTGAIQETSSNIANATTPGYTRKVAQFQEAAPSNGQGQGVTLAGYQSIRSELLQRQLQQQTQAQSQADAQSASLQQIQTAFTTSTQDVGTQMTALFTSLSSLSANPADPSLRQGVVSAGQNLVNSFHNTSAAITTQMTANDAQVSTDVGQINSITRKIAALNPQIAALQSTNQDAGALQDQQDQLVMSLSKLTDVSVTRSANGDTLTTSSGTPLVIGSESLSLQSATINGQQHVLDATGKDVTGAFTSGDLGGNLQMRDQVLTGLRNNLDSLAHQVGSQMNSAQTGGFDLNGNPGANLFTLPAGNAGSAATIALSTADPALIAASSDGSAGSNGNLASFVAVQNTPLPSGKTPIDTYAGLVTSVGTLTSNASDQSTSASASLLQLTNQNNAVSAVSIDEESVNLINFQQAYSAAAHVVSTIQALFLTTLNMVS